MNRFARKFLDKFFRSPYIYGPKKRFTKGKGCGLANTIFNTRSGKITLGNNVIFGHNVMVLTGYHDLKTKGDRRKTLTEAERNIVIHANAYIGSGSIIIGPAEIGENAVVGAGSIVQGTIPPDAMITGEKAKIRKFL